MMNFGGDFQITVRNKEFGNPIYFVIKDDIVLAYEETNIESGIIAYDIIGKKYGMDIENLINNSEKILLKNKLRFLFNKKNKKNTISKISKIYEYYQEKKLEKIISTVLY